MSDWLEKFGRYELDPFDSRIDGMEIVTRFDGLRDYAIADPGRFLAELEAAVAGDDGGFATFGAARLVWQMLDDALDRPAAQRLLEAGLDFKLDRGLRPESLNNNERTLLHRRPS